MTSPIEIIVRSRNRLARLAALRILLQAALPLAVTIAVAVELDLFNALAFDHFGYLMQTASAQLFYRAMLGLALSQLVAAGFLAWRSWSRADDFVRTADQIDRCVGGRQEVVTLATLSDPRHPDAEHMRSSLFPMLWSRVVAYLEGFEPRAAFKLELGQPLVRSLVLSALLVILLSTAAFALMVRPTPLQSAIRRLQQLADALGSSASNPARQQLAAAARDVAKDLTNPKLPPLEKFAELQALKQEFEKSQAKDHSATSANGNSSGGGNGSSGQGSGRGSGAGNGSGRSQTGAGTGHGGKANRQMIELQNDIAKAQVKLQQEADAGNHTAGSRAGGSGAAPKPGNNPDHSGSGNSSGRSGQLSEPQTLAASKAPSAQSPGTRHSDSGSMGDTHLGEFPKPGNYRRFYKPGESGAANLHNARYVSFRLPGEIESTGAGVLVPDTTHPQATTAFTNSPLKPERLPVSPDEEQLVPPRYRELIR